MLWVKHESLRQMLKRYRDASELKARAARYRALAQNAFDPKLIAEVRACASELDAEAARLEGAPMLFRAA
jgi:hypothetical protein